MGKMDLKNASNPAKTEKPGSGGKPKAFRIEKQSGPELFAGAGSALPDDPKSHPAFYERVPVLEVTESLLARAMMLYRDYYEEHGKFEIIEVGTYRGRGLKALLDLCASLNINVHITGMDSFEGLPALSDQDAQYAPANASYRSRVLFADVTEREVRAYIGEEDRDRYTLVKGFFSDTIATLDETDYIMAIIDCDLYSSHMDVMPYLYERLLPGGIMFFDDYHSGQYPMAKVAINEFLETKPEKLFHLGYATPKGNNVKTYIVKI